jgi:hypothetical protein
MSRSQRRTAAGILAAAVLIVAGCGASTSSPSAGPTAGPSAGPTAAPSVVPTLSPTAVPTPPPASGEPTEVPVETPILPAWTCDGSTVRLAATAVRAQQTGMTVLTKDPVGEITFTFESIGGARTLPEVEVRPSSPPFVEDASGLPVPVDGAAWATIVLRGGTGLDQDFEQTYTGPGRWTALEAPLVEVVRLGDFEAVSTWAVGLSGPYCVRAYPGAAGSDLVVEFRAQ